MGIGPHHYSKDIINPEEASLSVSASYELCNQFRDSLKPAFLKLAKRVNEISEEVSSIDISDQLNNYISKDELTRDDTIDLFAKFDNEHHVLTIQFEDTPQDGLIVFKAFAKNDTNQRQRRFYIKLVDGVITDYKGVEEEITIDGITIRPLARSEQDRINYMPHAELISDSSERLIEIKVDENYVISRAVIELCTCTREIVFSPSDLAYRCDIEALDKKITTLAEQSHQNDAAMLSSLEENKVDMTQYYTKTESDEKYALKSDVISVDLSNYPTIDDVNEVLVNNYRQKNDLSTFNFKNIEFYSLNTETELYSEWRVNEFVEGMHVSITIDTVSAGLRDYEFDLTGHEYKYNPIIYVRLGKTPTKYSMIVQKSETNIDRYDFKINSITYKVPDEIALKSIVDKKIDSDMILTAADVNYADISSLANFDAEHVVSGDAVIEMFEYIKDIICKDFLTQNDLTGYATEAFVTNKIAIVQLDGKEDDITKYFKEFPIDSYEINMFNGDVLELKISPDLLCKPSGTLVAFKSGDITLFIKLVFTHDTTVWFDSNSHYALEYKEISALLYKYNGSSYSYDKIRVVISPDMSYYFMQKIDNKINIDSTNFNVLRDLFFGPMLIEDLNLVPSINYIRWRSNIINNLEHDEVKTVPANS